MQVVHCFTPVPLKQESLLVENAPDPLVGEQVNNISFSFYVQHLDNETEALVSISTL